MKKSFFKVFMTFVFVCCYAEISASVLSAVGNDVSVSSSSAVDLTSCSTVGNDVSVSSSSAVDLTSCSTVLDEIPVKDIYPIAYTIYGELMPRLVKAKMYMDDIEDEDMAYDIMSDPHLREFVVCCMGERSWRNYQTVALALYVAHIGVNRAMNDAFIKKLLARDESYQTLDGMIEQGRVRKYEKKYYWMLRVIWHNHISLKDIEAMYPRSYMFVNVKDMHVDGKLNFTPEIEETLFK